MILWNLWSNRYYLVYRVLKMVPKQCQSGTGESYLMSSPPELGAVKPTFRNQINQICTFFAENPQIRSFVKLNRCLYWRHLYWFVLSLRLIGQCHIARRALFTLSTTQCEAVKICDFTVCILHWGFEVEVTTLCWPSKAAVLPSPLSAHCVNAIISVTGI